jgi:hypothetical protein
MSLADLNAAALNFADAIEGVDGTVWGHFTCPEIDAFADLLRAAGRADVAADVVFRHSYADTEDSGDLHAEIGDATRAQAAVADIAWTDRDGHRMAVEYVAEMA